MDPDQLPCPDAGVGIHLRLIEDGRDCAANDLERLEQKGHVMDYAADGLSGLNLAAVHAYEATIFALSLPRLRDSEE